MQDMFTGTKALSKAIGFHLLQKKSKSSWISNATIRGYIYGIKTKHTLLIADACFRGGLFRTRVAFKGESKLESTLFQMTSRKAITSGTLTEVPDDSVFMKYLLKNLESNQRRHLTSKDLFPRFKVAVMNNSVLNQGPQYGVVQGQAMRVAISFSLRKNRKKINVFV